MLEAIRVRVQRALEGQMIEVHVRCVEQDNQARQEMRSDTRSGLSACPVSNLRCTAILQRLPPS